MKSAIRTPTRVMYAPVDTEVRRLDDIVALSGWSRYESAYPWLELGVSKIGFVHDTDDNTLKLSIASDTASKVNVTDLIEGAFALALLWQAASLCDGGGREMYAAVYQKVILESAIIEQGDRVFSSAWPMTFGEVRDFSGFQVPVE